VNGIVDEFGRALVTLHIRANPQAQRTEIQAWIDTAFNGELVVPSRIIESFRLEQSAGIEARLADGSIVLLESYTCRVDWFGSDRAVEVIANAGEFPLLGIGLLKDRRLVVDYRQSTVTID
jgi:clan AA aspartic protease